MYTYCILKTSGQNVWLIKNKKKTYKKIFNDIDFRQHNVFFE